MLLQHPWERQSTVHSPQSTVQEVSLGGTGILACAREFSGRCKGLSWGENVGAPTLILNIVVNVGAGTTCRAAVANGAGMIGVSGEWLVASGEPEKSGERTASFLIPDRWSLIADNFFRAPPPCFYVCTGMIGLTGAFRGCTGIVGLSVRKSEDKAKGEGVGRSEMVQEQASTWFVARITLRGPEHNG